MQWFAPLFWSFFLLSFFSIALQKFVAIALMDVVVLSAGSTNALFISCRHCHQRYKDAAITISGICKPPILFPEFSSLNWFKFKKHDRSRHMAFLIVSVRSNCYQINLTLLQLKRQCWISSVPLKQVGHCACVKTCLFANTPLEWMIPCNNFQRKILTLGGTLDLQMQENLFEGTPPMSLAYKDLTKNRLEAEWGQTTESGVSESKGKKAESLCQSSNSSGDSVLRRSRSQLFSESSEIEISGVEE